jgi:hypothetical protein
MPLTQECTPWGRFMSRAYGWPHWSARPRHVATCVTPASAGRLHARPGRGGIHARSAGCPARMAPDWDMGVDRSSPVTSRSGLLTWRG